MTQFIQNVHECHFQYETYSKLQELPSLFKYTEKSAVVESYNILKQLFKPSKVLHISYIEH